MPQPVITATTPVRLTEYSHGSGCGCKIAPALLDNILKSSLPPTLYPQLLVGNESRDDAAVYDLGNGTSVVSTTDFFMPIVDDPFEFGQIAATNAISDIYAMGGSPLMAIAIFGWPIDKLGPDIAQQVIEGGRHACKQAGIPLAGGHSIDAPEPIFGLAVTGLVENDHITHRVLHVQLVARIARTIGRFLRLNEDLIEAIALGHDIGHAPFGHDGERFRQAV